MANRDGNGEGTYEVPLANSPHCFKCHGSTDYMKSLYDSANGPSYHLYKCARCENEMWTPVLKS